MHLDDPYILIPVSPGRFAKASPEDAHLAADHWEQAVNG